MRGRPAFPGVSRTSHPPGPVTLPSRPASFLFPCNVLFVRYDPVMNMPPPPDGTAVPQPKVKRRLKIEPEDNSRLAMLMARLPELEVQKREAAEKLEEHKKAIQQEIAAFVVANGLDMPDVFDLPADPYGAHPAYTLSAREGAWRVDTEAMKSQEPETYVKWAKKGNPYWELKRVQKNRVHRG